MLRFAVLALALMPLAAEPQQARSFKDWSVLCAEAGHCTVFGFGPDTADTSAYVRIERGIGADAKPQAWIVLNEASDKDRQVSLTLDGTPSPALPGTPQRLPKDERRIRLSFNDTLIAALRKGSLIEAQIAGADKAPISLAGAVAALIWMDDYQGRVGTPAALIAKTGKNTPFREPIPKLLRKPAPVTPLAEQPPVPPALMQAVSDECSLENPAEQAQPEAVRLTDTKILWSAVCNIAAYNIDSIFFIEEAGSLKPAVFASPKLDAPGTEETNSLTLAEVEPQGRTVSSFARGRGFGDCGVSGDWIWDGVEFRLTAYHFMPECKGVQFEDWPDLLAK
ncbi:DUF1176 domain-containing protein [Lacibacterium aquatile]|uniref:DUF1176 domain-containing protein n=1 Tax=Lacibacterium aquatile TaxID=1168082 RepID=A0ABW5DWD1_9PROT